jgi:hypothetical protein
MREKKRLRIESLPSCFSLFDAVFLFFWVNFPFRPLTRYTPPFTFHPFAYFDPFFYLSKF